MYSRLFLFILFIFKIGNVFGQDFTLCKGKRISFVDSITSVGITPIDWTWYFSGGSPDSSKGKITPFITYTDTGLFSIKCKVLFSDSSITIKTYYIKVYELRIRHIPIRDTGICYGGSVELISIDSGSNLNYLWTSPNVNIPGVFGTNQSLIVDQIGTYNLRIFNACNFVLDTIHIKLFDCGVYLPTAFTPDGNSVNDIYIPIVNTSNTSAQMSIYNRWGEKLYETWDINKGWNGDYNGKPCQLGSYICVLNVLGYGIYSSTFLLIR